MHDTQKPELDELIHYGKKGMKWGVRNRPSTQEIKSARKRNVKRVDALFDQEDKVHASKSAASKAAATKKYDKMAEDIQRNPDTVTSRYMTRGEQAVTLLLVGPGLIPINAGVSAYRAKARRDAKKPYKSQL